MLTLKKFTWLLLLESNKSNLAHMLCLKWPLNSLTWVNAFWYLTCDWRPRIGLKPWFQLCFLIWLGSIWLWFSFIKINPDVPWILLIPLSLWHVKSEHRFQLDVLKLGHLPSRVNLKGISLQPIAFHPAGLVNISYKASRLHFNRQPYPRIKIFPRNRITGVLTFICKFKTNIFTIIKLSE